ncbi:hypothetical protein [Bifidobacterium myosotis]|uniref:Uncharacterized protein n=1 Tax=Bifidobacterium myosotis TaxID=1630166 RepID=A0A5M9ZHK9_9BIFI|nr:hypothetical protein [Bifidobacterium myosotis]KAA8826925.1 hypothetical protein EMO91_10360 [Bifidobacterium myosotis]
MVDPERPETWLNPAEYGHRAELRPFNRDLRRNPWKLWDERLLSATGTLTLPDGTVEDHRGERVMDPETQIRLADRASWYEDADGGRHAGRIYRALQPWFYSDADAREAARDMALKRLMDLRRTCVREPGLCFSEPLAASALSRPVRVEALFAAEPYRLSAHRMRVGRLYMARLRAYQDTHGGRLPNADARDVMWDDNMADYVNGKIAAGKTMGGGLAYSNGENANPDSKRRIRRGPDGLPFNARDDFERMLSRGMGEITGRSIDFESAVTLSGTRIAGSAGSVPVGPAEPAPEIRPIRDAGDLRAAAEAGGTTMYGVWRAAVARGMEDEFVARVRPRAGDLTRWRNRLAAERDAAGGDRDA